MATLLCLVAESGVGRLPECTAVDVESVMHRGVVSAAAEVVNRGDVHGDSTESVHAHSEDVQVRHTVLQSAYQHLYTTPLGFTSRENVGCAITSCDHEKKKKARRTQYSRSSSNVKQPMLNTGFLRLCQLRAPALHGLKGVHSPVQSNQQGYRIMGQRPCLLICAGACETRQAGIRLVIHLCV